MVRQRNSPPLVVQTYHQAPTIRCQPCTCYFDLIHHSKWRHVASRDNPVDLASRGIPAKDLVSSRLWWEGPSFSLPPDQWPLRLLRKKPPEFPSVPCLLVSCACDRQDTDFLRNLWKQYSSFHHLCRVLAWILRFSSNSRPNREERLLLLSIQSSEVIRAKQKILLMSQQETFADVFSLIQQGQPLPKGHRLKNYLI